jgi:trk system potassium uptake protein TrkA
MKIAIIGAGDIGMHLASLLSRKGHDVFLIDHDPQRLQEASRHLDIAVKEGEGSDWRLLAEITADLLLAFTDDDEVNLVACALGKQLGFKQTVARVRQAHMLRCDRIDLEKLFSADYLLGPELLVAQDLCQSLLHPGALLVANFAHGAVQMQTAQIGASWKNAGVALARLDLPTGVMAGLIRRGEEVLFPHGEDCLFAGDEVTFIGKTEVMDALHHYLGIEEKRLRSVILVGGSLIGVHLAQLLVKQGIHVRLISTISCPNGSTVPTLS